MAVINTGELKLAILKNYNSRMAFSRALGWNKYKVYNMLSGKYIPNVDEVAKIVEKLKLNEHDFITIFYPFFISNDSPNGDRNA